MSAAKFVIVVQHDAPKETQDAIARCGTAVAGCTTDPAHAYTVYAILPLGFHTRFELAKLPGVTVLPGAHDPAPIGDAHAAALVHVHAKPTDTMREIGLRLHGAHGPAFHPDS